MVKKEIKLKGSLHGTKMLISYNKPDIINSIVDNHLCQINDFKIKYLEEKKRHYIYHSYEGLDDEMKKKYTGRWYTSNYEYIDKDLNHVDNTFLIELKSLDWEDFETGQSVKKDVHIKIQLTQSGFNKLKKYFSTYNSK
jgi:hypothetical protein